MKKINDIEKYDDFISGKGADISDIENAENLLNIHFADDYKEYLIKYGMAMANGHEITGIGFVENDDVTKETIKQRLLNQNCEKLYVIENPNIDSVIIWQDESGSIFRTIPGSDPIKTANSLADYICN